MGWKQRITLRGASSASPEIVDQVAFPIDLDAQNPQGLLIHGVDERPPRGSVAVASSHGLIETALVASVRDEPANDDLRLGQGRTIFAKDNTSNAGVNSMLHADDYDMLTGRVIVAQFLGLRYLAGDMSDQREANLTIDFEVVDLDFDDQLGLWNVVDEGENRREYQYLTEDDIR